MNNKMTQEQKLFYTVAIFGGYLGGYAILSRCEVLGSAQTSNMASLVLAVLGRSFPEVLVRIGALMLYALALAFTVFIKLRTKLDLRVVSILISLVGVIVLYFIPSGIDNVLGLYPIFFVLAFQWNTFTGANGYTSSCIFSTNNLRQTVCSFTDYLCTKNQASLNKSRFFTGSIISYHIGVAASFFGNHFFGLHSIPIAVIPLAAALFEIHSENVTRHITSKNTAL